MSSNGGTRLYNTAPLDYVTPPFPSLYWPLDVQPGVANYLYYSYDIWRYTTIWTVLIFGGFHMAAAAIAVTIQLLGEGKTSLRYLWIIPLIYAVIAGLEGLLAGSIVGLILAAVYNAGYFSMSTWIPLVWAVINVLILIMSSFSIQGGL